MTSPEQELQTELINGAVGLQPQIGQGWHFIDRVEMMKLREGRLAESVVEPLLREALKPLNPDLGDEGIDRAVEELRRLADARQFLHALRHGLNVQLPGSKSVDVQVLDTANPANNDYVVTEEFELRTGGIREPRLDVVFLVNGLPLAIVENKSPTVSLAKAAQDFKSYWADAPQLTVHSVIAGIFNGARFRVAATGADGLSRYTEWKDTWPHEEPAAAGEMSRVLLGVLAPHTLVDLAANYVAALTTGGKAMCRYQQYRAVDKIVRRVRKGEHDRGLIWHTQGSGKTLTMFFAARKLRTSGFKNPTVVIVIDRVDLNTQVMEEAEKFGFADDFVAASKRRHLKQLLRRDERKVIVTTIHKFSEALGGLMDRDNVFVLADEAHRSQEGDLGVYMRNALPKAKLFAFTGTPVENTDLSTRKAFSPVLSRDGGQDIYEDYLDAYKIKDAIDDGATVPIIYESRMTRWAVRDEDIDEAFEHEFAGLSDEERAELRKRSARLATIAKTPERITEIADDLAGYLTTHTVPQGFKAQLVSVDRAACVMYAEALRHHFQPDEFAVVMSRSKNPPPDYAERDAEFRAWYASEQLKRLGIVTLAEEEDGPVEDAPDIAEDSEVDTEQQPIQEKAAVKKLIKRFKDKDDPLKLLIVNNMLLTGFDAPIEQVMFLDRGLSGHNLLQAIARTNRPAPGKDRGIIVDYWGVFAKLKDALKTYNDGDIELAAVKIDELRERFPEAVQEALAVVAGFPQHKTVEQQGAWLLTRMPEGSERAQKFTSRFEFARSIYESLAPDPGLADFLPDYRRLLYIRSQWRVALKEDVFDPAEHLPKSSKLVQEAIDVGAVNDKNRGLRIDSEFLRQLDEADLTTAEKAASIDAAIAHEIKVNEDDPVTQTLAEKLRAIRQRQQAVEENIDKLFEEYEQLVVEYEQTAAEHDKLGISKRAHGLLLLARTALPDADDDRLVAALKDLDTELDSIIDFDGWQDREDVQQDVRRLLIRRLAVDDQTRSLVTTSFIDDAVQNLAARAAHSG